MIKVVYLRDRTDFENAVNNYLSDGWRLNQPMVVDRAGYYAFLIIDEVDTDEPVG